MSDRALFIIAPYIAALIFIIATLSRTPGEPRALFRRHRFGALALLVVLAGHAAMWIAPGLLLAWGQSVTHVIAIELVMFVIGVIAAAGLIGVGIMALRERSTAASEVRVADTVLLGVLAVAVASGLALAARYRWASTWSAVTLTPYIRSLFALQPEANLLALPYLIKLHVFSGIALLAVLPFTSVMRPVLIVLRELRERLIAPVANAVVRQSRALADRMSESGRALVWPEEED
jgi:nitrate reductase gamma subunit